MKRRDWFKVVLGAFLVQLKPERRVYVTKAQADVLRSANVTLFNPQGDIAAQFKRGMSIHWHERS